MLSTSAAESAVLLGYLVALNIQDADVLLSTTKIRFRLDPDEIAEALTGPAVHRLVMRLSLHALSDRTQYTYGLAICVARDWTWSSRFRGD
jgi:hypothetical protein